MSLSKSVVQGKSISILALNLGEFLSLGLQGNHVIPDRVLALALGNGALSSVEAELELAVRVHLCKEIFIVVKSGLKGSESHGSEAQTSLVVAGNALVSHAGVGDWDCAGASHIGHGVGASHVVHGVGSVVSSRTTSHHGGVVIVVRVLNSLVHC